MLLLPLVKIRFMLIAAPLLALGWWHAGRPRKPLVILAGMLGAVAGGILLYNQLLYRNPLKIHTWQEVDPQRYGLLSYLKGGLGLFWDAAFGLFGCAPVWLLLLPAVLLLVARRSRLLLHLAALSLPYLVIVAPRIEWYGGWSPPFRYALIALPLLAVALVPLLARRERPGARALLAGLGALTLVLTLVWLTVPGWTYNFADGRTYALDALSGRLGLDVARFFPSSVRPRLATWVWPLLSLPLVTLLWWLPGRSRKAISGAGGTAALGGIALVLALAALLPSAASRVPTEVVELEDPQVWKSGGHVHPDRWVIERTRYRGGWVLRMGERLEVPVAPGGRRVRLELEAELIQQPAGALHPRRQGGGPDDRLLDSGPAAGLGDGGAGAVRLAGRRAAGARGPRPGAAGGASTGRSWTGCGWSGSDQPISKVQPVASDRSDVPSERDAPPFEDPESARSRTGASLRNGCAEATDEVAGAFDRPLRNLTVRNGTTVP